MDLGVFLTLTDRTAGPGTMARKIESCGFESLWLPDHILMPAQAPSHTPEGAEAPDSYRRMIDPLVALAAAAEATERIRLGTGIMVAPLRHPLITAKQIATLDRIAGGRLLVGVGTGWVEEEARIMGTDFPGRWQQTREHVLAMKSAWADGPSSFSGEYVSFPPLHSEPKPLQRPYPPVLLASDNEKAFARIAEFGDGWIAHARKSDPAAVESGRRILEKLFAESGRDSDCGEITVFGVKPERDEISSYASSGADRVVLMMAEKPQTEAFERLEKWAQLL